MKVYIAVDLEGISGVWCWRQVKVGADPAYQKARRLMMDDIAATIQGALDGGASEVIVRDGHHGGENVVADMMHPGATYIVGSGQGLPVFPGLDETVNAVILLGYHAMAGTANAVLSHTQSSASGRRYFYNGIESGEMVQHALIAGHFGVPVVMVTGDDATCLECNDTLGPGPRTVCTKYAYSDEHARLIPPNLVHEQLRRTAKDAITSAHEAQSFHIEMPIKGRLQFPDTEFADGYKPRSSSTRRVDVTAFERTFNHAAEVMSF